MKANTGALRKTSPNALADTSFENIGAEHSVLGALLLGGENAYLQIGGILTPEMFYRDDHRRIYGHIVALIDKGIPVDAVTVADAIEAAGESDRTGGLAYLGEIAANTATYANVRRYAEIVRRLAGERALAAAGQDIAAVALSTGVGYDEKLARAQDLIATLSQETVRLEPETMRAVITQHCESMSERLDGKVQGLSTGFNEIDDRIVGLRPGQIIVVGARPGMGKTVLASQMALSAAYQGKGVLFLSMEMSRTEIADRLVASEGRVLYEHILKGNVDEDALTRITAAYAKLADLPFLVDDQGGLTLSDVRAKIQIAARKSPVPLSVVVIDYLQLMSAPGDNRNAQLEYLSRELKAIAKRQGITIILLSQLSRKCDERPNKRPMASDLRDSGAVEQDADVIMFIYRDEIYHPDTPDRGKAEVIIDKNRNGARCTVPLAFNGEFVRFDSFSSFRY